MADGLVSGISYVKSLLSSSNVAITYIDKEGKLLGFSKGAESLTGFKPKEVIGKDISFFYRNNTKDLLEIRGRLEREGKVEDFETSILNKGGKEIPISLTIFPLFDKKKEFLGSVGISVGISARKAIENQLESSEKKYRELIDKANDMIYRSDLKGNILFLNRGSLDLLGVSSKEVLGLNWMDLVHADEREKLFESLKNFVHSGKSHLSFQNRAVTKQGKILYLDHSMWIKYDQKGIPVCLEGIARDITEKVNNSKLEEKIIRLEEKRVPLTGKEKLGLYALIKHPGMDDKKMAKMFGISRPTFTAIKNRLKREDYYKYLNMPRFEHLGSNLFSVFYCKISSIDTKQILDAIRLYPEIVMNIISKDKLSLVYMTTDIANFQAIHSNFLLKLGSMACIKHSRLIHFPLGTSCISSFMNFAPFLNKKFNLGIFEKSLQLPSPKPRKMTHKEKIALHSIIKYPEMNISELSVMLGIARATVSQMKKRFIKEGYIMPINVPNYSKVGYELIVQAHINLNNFMDSHNIKASHNHILSLYSHEDAFMLCAFENFTEFSDMKNISCTDINELGPPEKEPKYYIYPIKGLNFEIRVEPLLRKLLGV